MRQVPGSTHFLIIGDGRLARHFAHFLAFESIPFELWKRSQGSEDLASKAKAATHVLLAISDASISAFTETNAQIFSEKTLVHFSGALIHPTIPSAHPLMTFSHDLYEPSTYRRIVFITEKGRARLSDLIPGLKNNTYEIEPELKGLYHAFCVMSGNFTVLLWEKAFKEFETMGLPRFALLPYLERVALNLISSAGGKSVLTGPLARHDHETIAKNIESLNGDPFEGVYRAFVVAVSEQAQKANAQIENQLTDGETL
jgi:predicted short-subunit dehydrogenase-like oxidoreductase (DUF2520 family)